MFCQHLECIPSKHTMYTTTPALQMNFTKEEQCGLQAHSAEVRIRTHDCLPISPQCPQHQHYSQYLYGVFRLTQLSTPVKNSKNKPVFFSCPLFWRVLSQILLRKLMVTRNDPHTPPLPPQQFASRMFSKDTSVKVWSFTWGCWKMVGTLRGEAGTGVCLKGMMGTGDFVSSAWLQWSK